MSVMYNRECSSFLGCPLPRLMMLSPSRVTDILIVFSNLLDRDYRNGRYCSYFFELYFCFCSRRLHVVVLSGMARSKTPVKEVGVEVSRGNRGRGGRRPPTASYRKEKEKEKEKVDVKGKGKIAGNRAKNLQLHDESSNIDTRRQKYLVVAQGEYEAHASESSSSDSSAPADTTSTDRNVGESTSGGGGHNE
ncbi:hypothetical protein Scep_014728 [Stephania cephalantha]|uniref:Uncharacterized protein n=1 Tax=Stephania cephalantha TaxID=152367 RepID=A0AAP0J3W4_9MAGN